MKKTFIASVLLLAITKPLFAGDKVKLGLKVAPAISFASVRDKDNGDGVTFSSNGSAFRFVAGPYVDFMVNDNVSITTGIWYSPRAIRLRAKRKDLFGIVETTTSNQYNLQYLMIPLYAKFYTNEITNNLKLYFVLGGTFDIKIAEKQTGEDNPSLMTAAQDQNQALFSYVDASLMLGTGVEINLSDVTNFFVGISYNRGLVNTVNPLLKIDDKKPYQYLAIKNNLLSLDLGLKF